MRNKNIGVYQIRNLINNKKYIGQSTQLEERKLEHFYKLNENSGRNKYLQSAYNKYGRKNFIFEILIYCEEFELTKYEQFFVDQEEKDNLYNICVEDVNSTLGVFLSEETKKKLSNSHMGHEVSKETKEKISRANSSENNYWYGKTGEETPFYGKHHTKESKKKMSQNHLDYSGENNPSSKLTEKKVLEILGLYYIKIEKQAVIAEKYNTQQANISHICCGRNWKYCYDEFMKNNKDIV